MSNLFKTHSQEKNLKATYTAQEYWNMIVLEPSYIVVGFLNGTGLLSSD